MEYFLSASNFSNFAVSFGWLHRIDTSQSNIPDDDAVISVVEKY